MKKSDRTLLIGIGNNGRQDDGLGWMVLDALNHLRTDFDIEYRYQLQIEDAELISGFNSVIFIDATKENIKNGFHLRPCHPSKQCSFSTHTLNPETVLYLVHKLYDHYPKAYIFAIQGYEWNLSMGLSKKGSENLDKALKHFKNEILIDYI